MRQDFNLSPSGDWACYRICDYRQQMSVGTSVSLPPLQLHRSPQRLWLSALLPLPAPTHLPQSVPESTTLDLAINAVIQDRIGRSSFWALRHLGEQPDFHRRMAPLYTCKRPQGK